ncbi:MAG: hypothetical protein ACP5GX_10005 [Anaerolineae bacterium]
MALEHYERYQIRKKLMEEFGLGEMKDIAFDLGVKYTIFRCSDTKALAKALINFCDGRDVLGCLIDEVARRRANLQREDLLQGAPDCHGWKKLQIIITGFHSGNLEDLLEKLAVRVNVPPHRLILIAAAWEKDVRLLVAAPARTTKTLTNTAVDRFDGDKYRIRSIQDFDALGSTYQRVWRYIAQEHPPTSQADKLKPTIIWSDAYEIAGEDPNRHPDTPCRPLSLRFLGPVTLNVTDLAYLLEILMALGPIEILTEKNCTRIPTAEDPTKVANRILAGGPYRYLCIQAPDKDLSLLLSPKQVEIRGLEAWKPAQEEYDVAKRIQEFLKRRQKPFPFLDRWIAAIMPGRERLNLRAKAGLFAGERPLGQTTTILLVVFALFAVFVIGFIAGMLVGT